MANLNPSPLQAGETITYVREDSGLVLDYETEHGGVRSAVIVPGAPLIVGRDLPMDKAQSFLDAGWCAIVPSVTLATEVVPATKEEAADATKEGVADATSAADTASPPKKQKN